MEARRRFGEMLEDVRRGDEVVIERAGKTMGVMISPERYSGLERQREEFWKAFEAIQAGARTKDISDEEVERLVDEEVRAVRGKNRSKQRSA
jgi:prevent-host-death family protein